MRIVLMGTGPFAVPSFDRILASGHAIACVIARPPVPAKGKEPPLSPVIQWANEHGLPLKTPESINASETIAWLQSMEMDLMVVCDFGQILSRDALAVSRLGGINLHGSLLPRHRGAAPVQWSILAGDREAGVSVIHMTPALDAGPVLTQAHTSILPEEDAEQLERRLSQIGVEPTMNAIALLEQSTQPEGILQDPTLATRAPRLKKADGELHWGYPVRWIDRQLRGLQPWPGVFTQLILPDGKELRIIVRRSRPFFLPESQRQGLLPGVGTLIHGKSLETLCQPYPEMVHATLGVVARDGVMLIDSLQPAGKKLMTAEEFIRGYAKQSEMHFSVPNTPHTMLEKMMILGASEADGV